MLSLFDAFGTMLSLSEALAKLDNTIFKLLGAKCVR